MMEFRNSSEEVEPPAPLHRSIYPLRTQPGWKVIIVPYNPIWPTQFQTIKAELHRTLTTFDPPARYTTIEHIGSTSIPEMCGKPNIDILITLPSQAEVDKAIEAFAWEMPTRPPYIKYTRIPQGGGIQGRESFKLYLPAWASYRSKTSQGEIQKLLVDANISSQDHHYHHHHHHHHQQQQQNNNNKRSTLNIPQRSVYLINTNPTENPPGQIQIRNYRDVKRTLTDPQNRDLLDEYARLKWDLSTRVFKESIDYARCKNGMIRKVLLRAGWTDEEVDLKESLARVYQSKGGVDDKDDLPY